MDDTGRLGLVDFDRFAWGEPEFDLATFVVELTGASPGQPTAELETAVLDGFRAVAGEPDEQRLALYVLHRRLAKAARTACALRPDAEERAAPLLEELQRPLESARPRRDMMATLGHDMTAAENLSSAPLAVEQGLVTLNPSLEGTRPYGRRRRDGIIRGG